MRFASIGSAVLACVATAVLLSACSEPTPKEVGFTLKVELKHASPACDEDPHCWLPTQLHPRLVSGQSVSAYSQWPVKGDSVEVICQTTGEHIQDYNGRASDKWYGILVPNDKVASTPTDAKSVKGGYLGYVSAVWLSDTTKSAPAC